MANSDEYRTISVQLDPAFYDRVVRFTFQKDLTKSEAIRKGLELLMLADQFLDKGKDGGDKSP